MKKLLNNYNFSIITKEAHTDCIILNGKENKRGKYD